MNENFIARVQSARDAVPTKWALMVCVLIFVSTASARPTSSGSAASLDGKWYHDGKPTRILVAPDGRGITIVNELGRSSDGYAADPRNLAIPSLRITGQVSRDGRRISWTNGTEWDTRRKESGSGFGKKPERTLVS